MTLEELHAQRARPDLTDADRQELDRLIDVVVKQEAERQEYALQRAIQLATHASL